MIRIPYRVRYKYGFGRFVLGSLFIGGCAYFAWQTASLNKRGLTIDYIFHLTPGQATVFYWGMCAIGILFVVVSTFLFLKGILFPTYFELTATEMRLGNKYVPYAAITKVTEHSIRKLGRKTNMSIMVHANNRRVSISRVMLPSNQAYEEVKAFLASRVRRAPSATYSQTSRRR